MRNNDFVLFDELISNLENDGKIEKIAKYIGEEAMIKRIELIGNSIVSFPDIQNHFIHTHTHT